MKCPNCQVEFKPYPFNQLYCSPRCKNTFHKRKDRRRKAGHKGHPQNFSKTCKVCNTSFETIYQDAAYCTKLCRNRAEWRKRTPEYRIRKREYYRRYRKLHPKKDVKLNNCQSCNAPICRPHKLCQSCHLSLMKKVHVEAVARRAERRKVLKQARALRRVGRRPKQPKQHKSPCPICGRQMWNDQGRYISISCKKCMGLIFSVVGIGRASVDVLTPQRVSEAIAYINSNQELIRSYQWLKQSKQKLKKARKLLYNPKQAA